MTDSLNDPTSVPAPLGSPDRKRSLEDEYADDDDDSRGARFKRQALNSSESTALPVPPKREEQAYGGGGFAADGGAGGAAAAGYDTGVKSVQMRAIISTKEAGIIIGKSGRNVADIREQSGAKVMVSENVPGAMERILTISGPIDAVAKAFALVATKYVEEQHQQASQQQAQPPPPAVPQDVQARHTAVRLLVPHSQMGSVIGKQGAKIKEFQELSGAKIDAAEDMLPGSTERIVTLNGVIASIHIASYHIGNTLLEHPERSNGTIFFKPSGAGAGGPGGVGPAAGMGAMMGYAAGMRGGMPGMTAALGYMSQAGGYGASGMMPPGYGGAGAYGMRGGAGGGAGGAGGMPAANQLQQQIFIPNDMVGAIIGKGGQKINEIRRASGCVIKVADDPRDGSTERLVTITGTPDANQMALYMLYQRLESEKLRIASQQQQQQMQMH
ncbi:hypothetical protein HK405_013859 [Cladochytrium tenue]|nr:hypothetical protein HK405_013859 [Cladochytrium tenue]